LKSWENLPGFVTSYSKSFRLITPCNLLSTPTRTTLVPAPGRSFSTLLFTPACLTRIGPRSTDSLFMSATLSCLFRLFQVIPSSDDISILSNGIASHFWLPIVIVIIASRIYSPIPPEHGGSQSQSSAAYIRLLFLPRHHMASMPQWTVPLLLGLIVCRKVVMYRFSTLVIPRFTLMFLRRFSAF